MTLSKINQKKVLENLGFEHLNRMQNATISACSKNDNVVLLAPTGSGKTIAYLLGILPKLREDITGVQALILAPTRELALQIESVIKSMKIDVRSSICYGGHSFSVERKNLKSPPSILIGTPGRIQDHLERGTFDAYDLHTIVFDEFDKALEIGFSKQMEIIVENIPHAKSKILVSATNTIEIPEYLNFNKPDTLNFATEEAGALKVAKHIMPKDEKLEGLLAVVNQMEQDQRAIIFVNHREMSDRIGEFLSYQHVDYSVFHGGLEQDKRELELTRFRNGSSQLLIATDIAARGIDIPNLDYVIHYQIPYQESVYTHRNGRTARMKASGTSVLLLTDQDYLPEYITEEPEVFPIDKHKQLPSTGWATLHINRGKKHKVNKMDLVGFLLSFDFMTKEDLGLIEVRDFFAHFAVRRTKCVELIAAANKKKIKNKSAKFDFAR